MRQSIKSLVEIVYTPRCIVCGSIADSHLCRNCCSGIHFLRSDVVAPIRKHHSRLWALAAYEGPWLEVIHKFKYGKSRAALNIIDGLLKLSNVVFSDVDCIVPVPLSWRRYLKRGYNQSLIIAKMVAALTGRSVLQRAIVKSRHTRPQVGKSFRERRENLEAAFAAPGFMRQSVEDKIVLLVDDVVTSGATVDECARVLKRLRAKRVDVLTLAKTL